MLLKCLVIWRVCVCLEEQQKMSEWKEGNYKALEHFWKPVSIRSVLEKEQEDLESLPG